MDIPYGDSEPLSALFQKQSLNGIFQVIGQTYNLFTRPIDVDFSLEPMNPMATENEASAPQWWARHRLRYNVILIAAAPISFMCLLAVWWLLESRLPCLEITGFGIVLGAVLFAVGLVVANLLYFLGPLAEWLLHPRNTALFRRRLYTLGTAFSILVVFMPVLGNLAAALVGPSTLGKCS